MISTQADLQGPPTTYSNPRTGRAGPGRAGKGMVWPGLSVCLHSEMVEPGRAGNSREGKGRAGPGREEPFVWITGISDFRSWLKGHRGLPGHGYRSPLGQMGGHSQQTQTNVPMAAIEITP
jgi:hypothetical protein